eukprot:CAMPEP_0206261440 /NCGR_PEP_ID=MMETSP0047_2-20121206/27655_1 /ASSEMBLY_ACC=CAM_ASM_000192 /TAXON_ID=195065 /ORGANISM="Chroomonas mesostigmatica_cf, Strain CCMP1168" /LENGTH=60 /DNA_ID=CAMNT_0053688653 /DNA_START=62 /DNA_END=241 /DNA_ORIENTATION=+
MGGQLRARATFELPLVQVNYHPFDSENSGDQNVTKSFTGAPTAPALAGRLQPLLPSPFNT